MAQSAKVFLCHAGEQKLIFVEYLSHALRVEGISVFLDKESLKLGDTAPVEIFACLETVPVGAPHLASPINLDPALYW